MAPPISMTGLTVVKTAPITELRVDESGNGFPLSLLDPPGFMELKSYCNNMGLTQENLETLYRRLESNISAVKHSDGVKKRSNRVSLVDFQQSFDHMHFENISLLFLPKLFVQEIEGLRPPEHDSDVDFSRFTVAMNSFAVKNDLELLLAFFGCLLPSYQLEPITVVSSDSMKMIADAVHTTVSPELQLLLDAANN